MVRLPEGTREITVPNDFRFTVDGKPLSVQQLKPGMSGTATITTTTKSTPVTVTEVKNGTVVHAGGPSIIVRTEEGFRMFTQGEIDKRGVKILRAGKPALASDFRTGDKLSAVIITSMPPRVVSRAGSERHAGGQRSRRRRRSRGSAGAAAPSAGTSGASGAGSGWRDRQGWAAGGAARSIRGIGRRIRRAPHAAEDRQPAAAPRAPRRLSLSLAAGLTIRRRFLTRR